MIHLTWVELLLATVLMLLAAGLSLVLRLGIAKRMLIAGLRNMIQLLLLGLLLKVIFASSNPLIVLFMALVMILAAGREAQARQKVGFKGLFGFGLSTMAMFISSFLLALIASFVILKFKPWYNPQYLIPILGMLLGNSMNGIALGLGRLSEGALDSKALIEQRLALGQPWCDAMEDQIKSAMRMGMLPIINSMASAGLVSLPGMMTGQIIAGADPFEAVKYQIMIFYLIGAGTAFATAFAVRLGARRLFDERHRLRLDVLEIRAHL